MEIAPVSGGRDLERFIAFPYEHYRGDPLWAPQLRMDVRTLLSPGKNPFFRHAAAQYFLARAGGRTVGRIAAIQNDAHNEVHQDRVGFYGFSNPSTTRPWRTPCGTRRPTGCAPGGGASTRCAAR